MQWMQAAPDKAANFPILSAIKIQDILFSAISRPPTLICFPADLLHKHYLQTSHPIKRWHDAVRDAPESASAISCPDHADLRLQSLPFINLKPFASCNPHVDEQVRVFFGGRDSWWSNLLVRECIMHCQCCGFQQEIPPHGHQPLFSLLEALSIPFLLGLDFTKIVKKERCRDFTI